MPAPSPLKDVSVDVARLCLQFLPPDPVPGAQWRGAGCQGSWCWSPSSSGRSLASSLFHRRTNPTPIPELRHCPPLSSQPAANTSVSTQMSPPPEASPCAGHTPSPVVDSSHCVPAWAQPWAPGNCPSHGFTSAPAAAGGQCPVWTSGPHASPPFGTTLKGPRLQALCRVRRAHAPLTCSQVSAGCSPASFHLSPLPGTFSCASSDTGMSPWRQQGPC